MLLTLTVADSARSLHPGTENSDLEKQHLQSSQESWVQRMLMALVGDSALFNTREGRAGKVHNFMLGLNLNTSYPLSPLAGLCMQESLEEDEMDTAVAGTHVFSLFNSCKGNKNPNLGAAVLKVPLRVSSCTCHAGLMPLLGVTHVIVVFSFLGLVSLF